MAIKDVPIFVVCCQRAGAVEYPVKAFTVRETADVYVGWMNRNARPLVNYRVSEIVLNPSGELRVLAGAHLLT